MVQYFWKLYNRGGSRSTFWGDMQNIFLRLSGLIFWKHTKNPRISKANIVWVEWRLARQIWFIIISTGRHNWVHVLHDILYSEFVFCPPSPMFTFLNLYCFKRKLTSRPIECRLSHQNGLVYYRDSTGGGGSGSEAPACRNMSHLGPIKNRVNPTVSHIIDLNIFSE